MAATGAPRCSVIISAYNSRDFVAQATRSAIEQEPAPQVIVVDDGSTDDTAAVTEAAMEGAPDARLVRRPNGGCPAARLTGLEHATGDVLVFLDADDELLPGALEAHMAALEAYPEAAMVFGANHRIDEGGARLGSYPQPVFETRDAARVALEVTPAPSQCAYRRSGFEAVGGYDASLRLCEDSDMNIRITEAGSIVSHGAFVMNYRMHGGQMTKRPSRIYRAHIDVIRRHLGPGGRFADPAALARCERKWARYYGANIPVEILRTARRGDMEAARAALGTFVAGLPHSAAGAAAGAPALLRRRFG